jgi:antitoxin component of MazEF toxin-antitoxin module
MTIEMFNGRVTKVGGSLSVLIPYNIVRYNNIKEGDNIKFYFKKTK